MPPSPPRRTCPPPHSAGAWFTFDDGRRSWSRLIFNDARSSRKLPAIFEPLMSARHRPEPSPGGGYVINRPRNTDHNKGLGHVEVVSTGIGPTSRSSLLG